MFIYAYKIKIARGKYLNRVTTSRREPEQFKKRLSQLIKNHKVETHLMGREI